MEIGVYFCVSILIFYGAIFLLAGRERTFKRYALLSGVLIAAGIVAFEALSVWAGLMRFGVPQTWRYPGDYLERGPVGWVIMLVPLLGLLSPFGVAFALRRRGTHPQEEAA